MSHLEPLGPTRVLALERAVGAALLALLVAGCSTVGAPRLIGGIGCAEPPAPRSPGGSYAIARGPSAATGPVTAGVQINRNGNIPVQVDLDALGARLATDLVGLLHGRAANPPAPGERRLEVHVTRVATGSEGAGFFDLMQAVRSEIVAEARVVGAQGKAPGGAGPPATWTFRGLGEKTVAYVDTEDHAEALSKAYCDLLRAFAARSPELAAAMAGP